MTDFSDRARQVEAETALCMKIRAELHEYICSLNLMVIQRQQLETLISDLITAEVARATL